jgi:type IV pilus assembly protein PilY1
MTTYSQAVNMNNFARLVQSKQFLMIAYCSVVFASGNSAHALDVANEPLFLSSSAPPLNLLVLGRDHKLYYEAYNDHSDLDGDGTLDTGYKSAAAFNYFGYFDPAKCYTYSSGVFVPVKAAVNKTCPDSGAEWSGDWLNYATTSRIDALRKVLYGGTRSEDTATRTVLERSHVPQDAHSWGKEYENVAVNGYDISLFTPYSVPSSGRHLFANVTLMRDTDDKDNWDDPPLLRVAENQSVRIWNWVSVESPVAGICVNHGLCEQSGGLPTNETGPGKRITITDYTVRVEVCKGTAAALHEPNCLGYPSGNFKPIGLLQQYGENDTMKFGLLTGSYAKSKSGGVLRQAMDSIKNEINVTTDGTLKANVGVIRNIDRLRSAGYDNYRDNAWYRDAGRGAGVQYSPGLVTTRPFNEGEFGGMWGNPIAEMMYEGMRYFAGKSGPLADYDYGSTGSLDSELGLERVGSWTDPYSGSTQSCAKPFELVMSDVNVSYDSDQLPGVNASFGSGVSNHLPGSFSASTEADKIWTEEALSGEFFIGQSGATYDGAPTPKAVSGFSSIRGLSPEEPTKQGSYYSAAVAKYGLQTDISGKSGDQKVQTFAVALASPLPRIDIKGASGTITIMPFGKSVGGSSIDAAKGKFQPTNQIVDFYVESLSATSGTFQVNFEDVEAGNDHDMDAIVRYTYSVSGDDVTIKADSDYAAGGIIQHMGYVVSGSTSDGIYLVVRDSDTGAGSDVQYFLDTPPGKNAGGCDPTLCARLADGSALPLTSSRTFKVGTTTGAGVLKDPLWYAAKWGGFKDGNKNNKPDQKTEWDTNNDGNPDNYFLVTNALTLGTQLTNAFDEILKRVASASSATVNSGSVSSSSRVFQATFDSGDWTGHLLSYKVDPTNGKLSATPDWDAADSIPAHGSRKIFTMGSAGTALEFTWDEIKNDATRKDQLGSMLTDTQKQQILDYVRGSADEERKNAGPYRTRPGKLGDVVNSSPMFVGSPSFFYSDTFETAAKYSVFRTTHKDRKDVIYVGANDGMLHAFDASDVEKGKELFAYIPGAVFKNLPSLADTNYAHKYFVDGSPNVGDVYTGGAWRSVLVAGLNGGGQGIYALDVTDPGSFSKTKVLWEFTDRGTKGDKELGYTFSQPAIVKLNNGKWGAIFGNGYNSTQADGTGNYSTTGNAALFIVDMADGTLIKKIDTQVGSDNGLATPAVVDFNGDNIADYVYAGDLKGNLWKFDITGTSSTSWKVAYAASGIPKPVYEAKDSSGNAQPITSRPEVVRGPNGVGMTVLFGTGKYLGMTDKIVTPATPPTSASPVQSVYGIVDTNKDSSDAFTGRGDLNKQEILKGLTVVGVDGKSRNVRITTDRAAGTRGWYMDLLTPPPTTPTFNGERAVANPVYRADGDRIVFTTLIPAIDPCSDGGGSWILELNPLTGARLKVSPVDVNGDGKIDDKDKVTWTDEAGNTHSDFVTGVESDVGIIPAPGILADPDKPIEYKYSAGSSGNIQVITESARAPARGRQSWRPDR